MSNDDADVTMTPRSFAPLTGEHLSRLSAIAADDRERFALGRPEYIDRPVATVLAQGGALHFIDGTNGVKDLDVWSFYSLIPGTKWAANRRNARADFGPSSLGRQQYDLAGARHDRERRMLARFEKYHGRRVDLLMRALSVLLDTDPEVAVRTWLTEGQRTGHGSAWFLAQKAVVMIDPDSLRGNVIWHRTGVAN